LFLTPAVVPWMATETEQEALAGSVPPERLTLVAAATAVAVPPHELVRPGVAPTTRPAGRLSVNARPVSVTFVFGFEILKVSVVVPFSGIADNTKPLVIEGGAATVRFAEAVVPVPPFVELTALEVFVY
jgi:hypothetical protein